jgi:glycosyltransferase involved in cell wall biosynthesis
LRIGYLIGALGTGGSERQLSELAAGMVARGHEVEIAAYDGAGAFDSRLEAQGVKVRRMTGGSKRDKLRAVRRWARTFDPDVLHGFMKRASGLAVLANLPRRRRRVVASDLSTATYMRGSPALWGALVLFAMADRVATQTETNRRSLRMLAPWLRSKVVVVRNGVDTGRFVPSLQPRRQGSLRFLCVGTVYRLKNPVRLVEAVRLLHDRRPGFTLDWVGNLGQGGGESEEYRQAAALVREHGMSDVLRFAGPADRIETTYHDHDALVHVSVQEGMPNAVLEGMACGLPLVVSRVSDLPLIAAEGRNGFVCDETSPASIAEAMERMLDLAEPERLAMGARSRELAVRWFGRERFLIEYETLYRNLLGNCR